MLLYQPSCQRLAIAGSSDRLRKLALAPFVFAKWLVINENLNEER